LVTAASLKVRLLALIERGPFTCRQGDRQFDRADRIDAEFAKTKQGKLEATRERSYEKHYALLWDLSSTAPATLRGAIAVLAYIRESQGLRETVYGEDDTSAALGHSMERYLYLLVGLPAPPMSEHMTQIMEEMAECA
jgi:hypothetical protein